MSDIILIPTHHMQNSTHKSKPEFMQVQANIANYLSRLPCSTLVFVFVCFEIPKI
jgi:hypothetical protein